MTYYRCLSRTKTSRGTGMESARVYSCEYRASNMWIRAYPYITHYFSYGIRTGFFTGKRSNSDSLLPIPFALNCKMLNVSSLGLLVVVGAGGGCVGGGAGAELQVLHAQSFVFLYCLASLRSEHFECTQPEQLWHR